MSTYDNAGCCCPRCGRGSNLEVVLRPSTRKARARLGLRDGPKDQVRCYSCGYRDEDFDRIVEAIRRDDQQHADAECERVGHRVVALLGKCVRCNRAVAS